MLSSDGMNWSPKYLWGGYVDCLDLATDLCEWGEWIPKMTINAFGFTSKLSVLSANGWKARYRHNRYNRLHYMRFLHEGMNITFEIKASTKEGLFCHHDVSLRSHKKIKHDPVPRDFTIEDVPALLSAIVRLQEPVRKKLLKNMELPNADIITLKRTNI